MKRADKKRLFNIMYSDFFKGQSRDIQDFLKWLNKYYIIDCRLPMFEPQEEEEPEPESTFNKEDLRTIKTALLDEIKHQSKNGPLIIQDGKIVEPGSEDIDISFFIDTQNENIMASALALYKVFELEAVLNETTED